MSQYNDIMNKKAVALSYDEDTNSAPVIVASGMGHVAQKIVDTARESGVPVYEDNSLATMLTQLELGSEIPPQLYQAIVDIYVYFLNFASKGVQAGAADADGGAPQTAETSAETQQTDGEGIQDDNQQASATPALSGNQPVQGGDADRETEAAARNSGRINVQDILGS